MRRYGYGSLKQLNTVVDSYAYAKIPLETFVTDSQYMLHDQDFTLGEEFPAAMFQVCSAAVGSQTASCQYSGPHRHMCTKQGEAWSVERTLARRKLVSKLHVLHRILIVIS